MLYSSYLCAGVYRDRFERGRGRHLDRLRLLRPAYQPSQPSQPAQPDHGVRSRRINAQPGQGYGGFTHGSVRCCH